MSFSVQIDFAAITALCIRRVAEAPYNLDRIQLLVVDKVSKHVGGAGYEIAFSVHGHYLV